MTLLRALASFCAFLVVSLLLASPAAAAQASRTWVSGVGDDANPCSRTAPCKTFAGAISKTTPGGEINCLDPGEFGAVTITKSMSIICDDVSKGGASAVEILIGTGNEVVLRGLDIEGDTIAGISVAGGGKVIVDHCIIRGFDIPNAAGISVFSDTAGAVLSIDVEQSTIANNSSGIVLALGAEGDFSTTATITATITDSLITQSSSPTGAGIQLGQGAIPVPASAVVILSRDTVSNGAGAGLWDDGIGEMIVGGSTITGNAIGIKSTENGQVLSYGNNAVNGNGSSASEVFNSPRAPLK